MANATGKHVDKTYLSVDQAEKRGFIHRDYIAHCLRWSHVIKALTEKNKYKEAHILDIGCGRETPLVKTLYSSRLIPASYTGVDVGPIKPPDTALTDKFPVRIIERRDIIDIKLESAFNTVVCFEVLEHVEPVHAVKILHWIYNALTDDGVAFLSTPCYNPDVGAAGNHVSELKWEVLGRILWELGFHITGVWGTFASIRDYKDLIESEPGLLALFNRLRTYYDVNYIATIFAPLYPHRSRNCLWEVRRINGEIPERFRPLPQIPKPWGSSDQWDEAVEWLTKFNE
jgi:hypothetical protein